MNTHLGGGHHRTTHEKNEVYMHRRHDHLEPKLFPKARLFLNTHLRGGHHCTSNKKNEAPTEGNGLHKAVVSALSCEYQREMGEEQRT